ncbi:glycosyltransferase family 2 protein [Flavobacterium psychrophilum]|uniref:glycosyltransferase family 2 protein n=1 Tax=Flavobacterium psychrophilum TaxID=96345 RepID=UPI00106CBDC6|nr:glycosyltransferase [Flavobacterium psychrophilum]
MKNLVSIIVPCYNGENYLNNTLESVFNQEYKNWECVIVNDGSTDQSSNIIDNWVKKDNRFFHHHQENQGLSTSRNNGVQLAKGEYIFFLDADDLLPSNSILDLINSIDIKSDFAVGITQMRNILTTEFLGETHHFKYTQGTLKNLNKEIILKIIEEGHCVTVMNKIYRKTFIEDNSLQFKKGILHEDYLWFFETWFLAKQISFCNKETYYYHTNNIHSITNNKKDQNIIDILKSFDIIKEKYYNNIIFKNYKEIIGIYLTYFKTLILKEVNTIQINNNTLKLVHNKFKKNQYPRSKPYLSLLTENKHYIFTLLSFNTIKTINKYFEIIDSPKKYDRYKRRFILNRPLFFNFFKIKHYNKKFIWKLKI